MRAKSSSILHRLKPGAGHFFRSRHKIGQFLKTLALVAPLTFLIWIYAERAQVWEDKAQITFALTSSEPGQSAILTEPSRETPITIEMTGPRAAVERVKSELERQSNEKRLRFQLASAYSPNSEPVVSVVDLLNADSTIKTSGVSVTKATPSTITARIDAVDEREVPVKLPPDVSPNVQNVVIDPPTVRVRGPKSAVEQVLAGYNQNVVIDFSGYANQLRTPGSHVLERVPLKVPEGITAIPPRLTTVRLMVTANELEHLILSIPIVIQRPLADDGKSVVEVTPRTITNVRVRGPAESIQKLQGDAPTFFPTAVLQIRREDVGKSDLRRAVKIDGLPPNVEVIDGAREVDFTVRETADASG
ncbi:MAG TPA: hypothetical protein VGB55_01740 [Tepidisphaeraceae bacterium]|jgi:hypothetical protein